MLYFPNFVVELLTYSPPIGVFYLMIWTPDKPEIDKAKCKCDCFDTVFRGRLIAAN